MGGREGLEIQGFADGDDLAGGVGDQVEVDPAVDDGGGIGAEGPIEMAGGQEVCRGIDGDAGVVGEVEGEGGGGGGIAIDQVVQSFINQSEITVEHNLHKYPTVVVVDTTGRELIPEITHESTDRMIIRLNPAASGKLIYS